MRRQSLVLLGFIVAVGIAVTSAWVGWLPIQAIWQTLQPETAHQRYGRSLVGSGLANTALAIDWFAAAARALQQPVTVSVPFTEEALIDPARPNSLGYAVALERGQTLTVEVSVETDTPGRVFVDLFDAITNGASPNQPVASARDDQTALTHEVRRTGTYLLRIQPELLRGGNVRVTSMPSPSLRFPVSRGAAASIQSDYGDVRDGGRRRHEGVDIFAPRGTPVVASSDGIVTNVGENRLGGRVVWVWDPFRGVRIYYAHLHEQLVRTGAIVRAGEALGTVGNTGNAKTTAPHLHFGIYARREGALNPDPFIRPVAAKPVDPQVRTTALGGWAQTRHRASLRASPSADSMAVEMLPSGRAIRIEGAYGSWVRTSSGDRWGFLEADDLRLGKH
jgi:murein DD-endopeptidase MepM/ murein hydrolase activator NlpD